MKQSNAQIIEKVKSMLTRREAALKDTLDQITIVEKAINGAKDPQDKVTLEYTLGQLRIKRMRQHANVQASHGFLKALGA